MPHAHFNKMNVHAWKEDRWINQAAQRNYLLAVTLICHLVYTHTRTTHN